MWGQVFSTIQKEVPPLSSEEDQAEDKATNKCSPPIAVFKKWTYLSGMSVSILYIQNNGQLINVFNKFYKINTSV